MPENEYSINDLARLTGLSVRTIRYYIAQGLIPASGESGPGAHYGQGHLDRLQLIKRLQTEYLPNAEIRRRLTPLSDADVAALVAEPPTADQSRPTTSALDYVRGVLGASALADPTPSVAQAPPISPPATPRFAAPRFAASVMPAPPSRDEPFLGEGIAPELPPPASEIREAIAIPDPAADAEPQEGLIPERSQWERLSLTPDIELHIRRPLSRQEQKRVDRLITIARQVLKEGKP